MNLLREIPEKKKISYDEDSLCLEGIKKNYSGGFSLNIDTLVFLKGQVYVIMGPNGSGKTALLNIASSLEKPDKGQVKRAREVGYVMQEAFLFNRSVYDNVAYGLRRRKKFSKNEIDKRVRKALSEMGIEHLRNRNAKELSGGEKKRVSIAQVMVLDTDIVLMDEPMAGVDEATVVAIEKLIERYKNERNKTVVITTHFLDQAYRLSADIITLKAGRVSAFVHENTFYGIIKKSDEGIGIMTVFDGVDIFLVSEKTGPVHIAIDPESIILSEERFASSARNLFYGTMTKVEELGPNVRVFVDCGIEFCSVITKKSYSRMGLNIGSAVYLSFKVNSVRII
ncbi:MAG: ABC transporter ATP-binding protein [Candidatus Omnitrophica bacterium]|nr:ABC transporter ATP-binding protein [Candidatus Omnitrophota bacterium]MBU1127815.1 ABC transporter ATP-binding protein [Candidatus Omnitrophota bacterium]MBU1784551.1 ABC transporter ATP-binding protein [Candidatus Omnitrophota bacterium]MBU1851145.1 ABC transporter ATP-binding protein [Candidatus Omnitrophota bacterium]